MMVYVENLRRYQMQTKYWAAKICRNYPNPISSLRTQIFGNRLMEARWKEGEPDERERQSSAVLCLHIGCNFDCL